MACIVEDFLVGAGLYDFPAIHDVDAVAHAGNDAKVVGDHDGGGAKLFGAFADELKNLCLDGDIQRGGGLVCNDQLRIVGQCNGDDDSLAHAAREFMRILGDALFRIRDADLAQELKGFFSGRGMGERGVI